MCTQRATATTHAHVPAGYQPTECYYERGRLLMDHQDRRWIVYRHTDLSQCYHMADGSLTDTYQYAMDPARLDFLGSTDHACDLNWANASGQEWWRSRKEVSQHLLARFISFYSFEHSRNYRSLGLQETDHNVIRLQLGFIPYPALVRQFGDGAFLIPHSPINANSIDFSIWDFHPPSHQRPLLESFQGFRVHMHSLSEKEAQRGLGDGHRIGFIVSSNYQSTSASYAAVWTTEISREAIFRALQVRRTFRATSPPFSCQCGSVITGWMKNSPRPDFRT